MRNIWCCRCKKETGNAEAIDVVTKNGRNAIKCKCLDCDKRKFSLVRKEERCVPECEVAPEVAPECETKECATIPEEDTMSSVSVSSCCKT